MSSGVGSVRPSYLVDDVRLVGGELATNAMVHATAFTVTVAGDWSVRLTVWGGAPEGSGHVVASLMDTGVAG